MQFTSLKNLTLSALIAALYASLTLLLAPISFGAVQFRVAEAMALLPILLPQAIPGVTLGCFVANLVAGYGSSDLIFGTLATLIAAVLTYVLRRNKWLAALPPVVLNGVIVGGMLSIVLQLPLFPLIASVAVGEAVVVYVLGIPLVQSLSKIPYIVKLGR